MIKTFFASVIISAVAISCNNNGSSTKSPTADSVHIDTTTATYDTTFNGFNQLSLQQKQLAYYLSEKQIWNHASQNIGSHVWQLYRG